MQKLWILFLDLLPVTLSVVITVSYAPESGLASYNEDTAWEVYYNGKYFICL